MRALAVCGEFDTRKCLCDYFLPKALNGSDTNYFCGKGSMLLEDGTYIYFSSPEASQISDGLSCTNPSMGCFMIGVDINNKIAPNRYGYDVFTFQANKTKVVPRGSKVSHGSNTCDPVTS